GGNLAGANSPNLTISPVGLSDTAANYNVVVSSASGTVISNNVSLSLTEPKSLCPATLSTSLDCAANGIFSGPRAITRDVLDKMHALRSQITDARVRTLFDDAIGHLSAASDVRL